MLISMLERKELVEEIMYWKEKRNAVLLAHNYQLPEIQDIADVLGDSLHLARATTEVDADVIVFCGVHFMAETSAILNPNKKVLLPDINAGCSLADSITVEQLREWKKEHPNATVVSYVNTSADVKAESDYCCTSSNAVEVVNAIPEDQEILFLPDMFLGSFVQRQTGRENMHIWMGECHVHAGIEPQHIDTVTNNHPNADLLVHPECGCSTSMIYLSGEGELPEEKTHILSTGRMLDYSKQSSANEFIVATETGIIHQMQKQNPDKSFYAANPEAVCPFMKMITLEKVLQSLKEDTHVISVPKDTAEKARTAIDRMVAIG
ncbi:quinolinate synthase [Gracilibacillus halotolerans]|uniref:Quinolinate synthase n=1 Tax=Gracilibacillus halotolerans TaxID=74386 RepID=A0A841REL0_9BACI|nr:quinolinate synthase NadA [Gracilibacillus halotolerans]MBB6512460.1 quinolinate synthase [Gracilibacillus halotolerans]